MVNHRQRCRSEYQKKKNNSEKKNKYLYYQKARVNKQQVPTSSPFPLPGAKADCVNKHKKNATLLCINPSRRMAYFPGQGLLHYHLAVFKEFERYGLKLVQGSEGE